ncbi:heme o synthase [Anaerobacillus sp. MEB173]|uniref:heme o synthase n=1 Tax=Anaerobacillus sp. MEB173 TaxID=3383345 RepID=UPI003F8E98AF
MGKEERTSLRHRLIEQKKPSLIADLKALIKAKVLIANTFPVFIGFWLVLHFSNALFVDYLDLFLLTVFGSTLVIAGALIINNWYDADIDSVMARTQHRPTVTGTISRKVVFMLGIATSVVGFVLLFFTTVEATIYAFIGWFTYVVLYTMWSKRRYTLNTVIGSVSGAVTPLIGWAAVESAFHIVPIALFLIIFIWQMPHTFAIAIKKYNEYKAAGVAMLPVVHGFEMTKRVTLVYIVCLLPLPFLLMSLGITFVIVAALLTIAWIFASIYGFYTKDDFKWAHLMFLFSVNYLMILFMLMFIVTLPLFS